MKRYFRLGIGLGALIAVILWGYLPHDELSGEVVTGTNAAGTSVENNDVSSVSPAKLENTKAKEIVRTVTVSDLDENEASLAAVDRFIHGVYLDSIARWRPVIVDPSDIVGGEFDLESPTSIRTPALAFQVSPFDDVTFTVGLVQFEDYGWGAAWSGQIVDGGTGDVTVHLIPDEDGELKSIVYVSSNLGHFNIAPTDTDPYYVAGEANPYHRQKID